MINPYRKLFNLFALSVLALAVYLNFFATDNDEVSPHNNSVSATRQQMVNIVPSKSAIALQNNKPAVVKTEAKN